MSESDHQSFYEIQLNTSHLLLVFLGAVVVGVTVFYLGVVIGRGQGTPTGLAGDWEGAAPVEDTAAADDTGEAGEEELGFYEEIKEEAGDPVASTDDAAGSSADTTEETGEAEAGPAGDSGGGEPAEPPTAAPDTSTPPSPRDTSGTSLPQADPGLGSGWVIQVRSTTDRSQADTLTRDLVADGYQAFVVSAEIDGTTWYRVRVGRYGSRGEAELVQERLAQREDIEQTWVTEG